MNTLDLLRHDYQKQQLHQLVDESYNRWTDNGQNPLSASKYTQIMQLLTVSFEAVGTALKQVAQEEAHED